jgi:5-methylcytosine-specific restriction endonuclease McrA
MSDAVELAHGVRSTYTNRGCRCDLCSAANREYQGPRAKAYKAAARATPEGNAASKRASAKFESTARGKQLRRQRAKRNYLRHRKERLSNRAAYARTPQGHALRTAANSGRLQRTIFTSEAIEYMPILLQDPCAYCGATDSNTIDHIDPVSKGGNSDWDNLTTACGLCNSAKHAKTLMVFLGERA